MIKQTLIEGFNKSTYGKNERDGERVLKNDLITEFNYEGYEEKITLLSSVISEKLYSQYSCKLDIDRMNKEIIFSHCTCDDYDKRSKKLGYCCKHLVATFFKFLNALDEDPEIKDKLALYEVKEELINTTQNSILDFLIGEVKKSQELRFEIVLNKIAWTNRVGAEFKIGFKEMKSAKLYTLKDIDSFLVAYYNNVPITYGKDFTFNIKHQKISSRDKKLLKFIELLKELDMASSTFRKVNERLVSGKQILIPKGLLKQFMSIIKNHRVYLGNGFYSRQLETEIIEDKIPLPMSLKELGNIIKLEVPRGLPESLTDNDDVFIYNANIYLPPEEQLEAMIPYIEAFSHGNSLFFTKNEENRILRELIPSIQKVTKEIELSSSLMNKVVIAPVNFKFYFDKEDEIYLTLKVCYGDLEFNYFDTITEKVVYRDKAKEDYIIAKIRSLGFEAVNNTFQFFKDEEYIFRFFKHDVEELQNLGEVYYSERFTGIINITNSQFKGDIRKGKFNYFELKFSIANITSEETVHLLRAFRDNKKYYKLQSGEFLDLEEIELHKFLKLIDSLEEGINLQDNTIEFHKNKGIFVENYLDENGLTYVKGRRGLKSLKSTLQGLKKKDFPLPSKINAKLRNYQKDGYYWLRTLDFLGLGGILGDEMGLGKTLQTITFLVSQENSKSIIVAPTSLLYNWKSEFNKFAPHIKVCILNGNIQEREELLQKYTEFDVLITTYNLLKRDMEHYEKIKFDYCILDEAQNIKNASSQNAKSVKNISAKSRFALTGTPIENSLMELWSIFDFIMPGYLYDEKRFTTRYHRRLEEDETIIDELNKLIKPFILRRYKKDVIKELPEKIEKKLIVPLDDEQQKVYSIFANHAQELIEKKVKDDEFKKSKIEILSYLTKLRQICLDPRVVMDNYTGGSGKIEALIEIINGGIDQGHKILVFSQFTSVLSNIADEFKNNNISYTYLDGSTPSKQRGKLVEDFNNDTTSVFLISLKAGGTGLNLTSADIVIHFDPWWNPAVEDQATDRAHRIGQENIVEVIKLISEGTIEEKIVSLQEEKRKLINRVVGEEIELGETISNLSEEDLISLLSR